MVRRSAAHRAEMVCKALKQNVFDNNDKRIPHYELLLERDLDALQYFSLPEGYHFTFYRPGDRDRWIEIEQSAREFDSFNDGIAAWERYYGARENELFDRMLFVETERGEKVATATAMYDVFGRDASGSAWLHWVAVRRDHQGKGLSKPLIAETFHVMKGLGFFHVKVPTQTNTWLAVKIYLDLGCRPIPKNAVNSAEGWRIVKTLTDHPALQEISPLPFFYRAFGKQLPGKTYLDRPGAYLIASQDGKLAVIQTPKGFFLPGGGTESDESDAECIRREVLEETGCKAEVCAFLCAAESYSAHETLGFFHPIQFYYTGRIGDSIREPNEPDHRLLWLPPEDVRGKLFPELQNWAIEAYLENPL